uniref:Uncharacterized protein n=1 Tax=Anguilla anguilla TaxID=7936 RepID=A0A0E9WC88_ANGAN
MANHAPLKNPLFWQPKGTVTIRITLPLGEIKHHK